MEVHVRVPLEKEVPLTAVLQEPKLLEEKPEFPELTEVRPVGPVRAITQGLYLKQTTVLGVTAALTHSWFSSGLIRKWRRRCRALCGGAALTTCWAKASACDSLAKTCRRSVTWTGSTTRWVHADRWGGVSSGGVVLTPLGLLEDFTHWTLNRFLLVHISSPRQRLRWSTSTWTCWWSAAPTRSSRRWTRSTRSSTPSCAAAATLPCAAGPKRWTSSPKTSFWFPSTWGCTGASLWVSTKCLTFASFRICVAASSWPTFLLLSVQVVDFRKKSVLYFDSMGGNNDEACRKLL